MRGDSPYAIIVTKFTNAEAVPVTAESEATRKRIKNALASQKWSTVTVLSSLLASQDELDYLPEEAIEEVAAFTNASINEVWGVASFYTNFRFTPPGDHIVEVCWGPTCHLLGATDILQRLLDDLGLSGEGNTQDEAITLKYNTCLGACSQAPVISIDHRLMGRLTTESAAGSVAQLTAGESK